MDLQKQNENLKKECDGLREDTERAQSEKQELRETIIQNEDAIANLQNQVTALLEGKETLNKELQQQREEIERLKKHAERRSKTERN